MNHKPLAFETDSETQPAVAEPVVVYRNNHPANTGVLTTFNNPDFSQKKPQDFDKHYNMLKTEADKIFGKDKRMTPDEYFDKLWYVVEGLYEHV